MKHKKTLIIIFAVVVLSFLGYMYYYINLHDSITVNLKELTFDGETNMWTENKIHNGYNIKFQKLNGSITKGLITDKMNYTLNVQFENLSGDLTLKIYCDDNVFLETSNTLKESLDIQCEDKKNVKIELMGNDAKGTLKLSVTQIV